MNIYFSFIFISFHVKKINNKERRLAEKERILSSSFSSLAKRVILEQ